jgi:hypothetical protein
LRNAGFTGVLARIHDSPIQRTHPEPGFIRILTDINTRSEFVMAQAAGADLITGTIISPPLTGESVLNWLNTR